MPENRLYIINYGKEDIKTNCKYCQKTKRNDCIHKNYGFECIIKQEKRKMNRCRTCYFGIHYSFGY